MISQVDRKRDVLEVEQPKKERVNLCRERNVGLVLPSCHSVLSINNYPPKASNTIPSSVFSFAGHPYVPSASTMLYGESLEGDTLLREPCMIQMTMGLVRSNTGSESVPYRPHSAERSPEYSTWTT